MVKLTDAAHAISVGTVAHGGAVQLAAVRLVVAGPLVVTGNAGGRALGVGELDDLEQAEELVGDLHGLVLEAGYGLVEELALVRRVVVLWHLVHVGVGVELGRGVVLLHVQLVQVVPEHVVDLYFGLVVDFLQAVGAGRCRCWWFGELLHVGEPRVAARFCEVVLLGFELWSSVHVDGYWDFVGFVAVAVVVVGDAVHVEVGQIVFAAVVVFVETWGFLDHVLVGVDHHEVAGF